MSLFPLTSLNTTINRIDHCFQSRFPSNESEAWLNMQIRKLGNLCLQDIAEWIHQSVRLSRERKDLLIILMKWLCYARCALRYTVCLSEEHFRSACIRMIQSAIELLLSSIFSCSRTSQKVSQSCRQRWTIV